MLPRQQQNSVKVDLNNKILKENNNNKAKDFNIEKFSNNNKKNFSLQPQNNPQLSKRASTSYSNNHPNTFQTGPSLVKQSSMDVDMPYSRQQPMPRQQIMRNNNNSLTNLNNQQNIDFDSIPQKNPFSSPHPNFNNIHKNEVNAGSHLGLSNSIVTTNQISQLPQAQTYDRDEFIGNNNVYTSPYTNFAKKELPTHNTTNNTNTNTNNNLTEPPNNIMPFLGNFNTLELKKLPIEELNQMHETLITTILTEEEDLIAKHREQLDKMCEFSRQEFKLLNDVEKPGSDIDGYVESLSKMLEEKTSNI